VKTGEKRWLPITKHVADRIRRLIVGRDREDFVFVTVRGAAVDGKNWYNRVWRKIRDIDGLATGMSVHDLRHVAATNAIAAGADVKLVQHMLGHKDASETLNTYTHLWPDRVDEVIASIEAKRAEALALAA
jgi:integrase